MNKKTKLSPTNPSDASASVVRFIYEQRGFLYVNAYVRNP